MFEVLNKSDQELLKESEVNTDRGTGPGGSKADTSETAVVIKHQPSNVTARSSKTRSQQKNKEIALKKLRRTYALQVRHEVDPAAISIPPSLRDYVENKLSINPDNRWYPFLVKLILDVFAHHEGQVSSTADVLDVSTGQLVRFFQRDESLWKRVNEMRDDFGQKPLRPNA